jgi:hypothetical protein
MNPKNQAWHPLDPAAMSLPREVEGALADGDSPCACVVVLVDSEIDRDWGAQASLAISKSWAASGHRVILADGCLDGPVLHEVVGVENGEGVSDMVLYGASVTRITGRVENRLVLASAGTPVVQIDEVMTHVRWDMVIRGCKEAKATLVFHVSVDTPGVEAMTRRADGVLVLASASKDVEALLGGSSKSLIAVLGPGNGEVPTAPTSGQESDVALAQQPSEGLTNEDQDELPIEAPPELVEDEEALPMEALPGLPEDEDVLADEASGGLAEDEDILQSAEVEDEAPAAFSLEDLPESASSPDQEGEAPDSFGMTGLAGGQYGTEDSPAEGAAAEDDQGHEVPISDDIEPAGVLEIGDESDTSTELDDASAEFGDAEVRLDDSVAEPGDVAKLEGISDAVDDVPLAIEESPADLDISADEEPFQVETPSMLDGAAVNAEPEADESPASDYGSIDLGVEESVDRVAEPEPAWLDPVLDPAHADEPLEAAVEEQAGASRPRYRGPARLERRRKRAAVARHLLTGVLTVLIVGGGGVAAAYFGLVNVPRITPADRVRSYAPPPTEAPGPIPETAIMSHVLLIDSWRDEETAWSTADALRGRLPDLLFFVTPVEVDGAPQFAVHVGPAYTAVEAEALKDPVAVVLDRLDPNDWEVREAPYGFYLGDYSTPGLAEARVQALAAASVPAYWVHVSYPDGTVGRRVYGGAFSDEYQAAALGRIISDAEVGEMVLTTRRGTLPE